MTERVLSAQLAEESEVLLEPPLGDGLMAVPDDLTALPETDAEQDARVELGQLRRAMRTRPVIDMARGILMASFGLNADDAWSVLVSVSQNTNTKLYLVADELVGAVTTGKIPKPFRRQLAVTIARLREAPTAPAAATARRAGEG